MSVRLDRAHIMIQPGARRAGWIELAAKARGMSVDEYLALLIGLAGEAMDARIQADRKLAGEVLRGRGARH